MCEKAGERLTSQEEVLFRQINPGWLDEDGEPSSQAFYPWRTVDQGCLSADRSSHTSAEQSFLLATALPPLGFGLDSVGVWGLSVAETDDLSLSAWSDPVPASAEKPANAAHALIEFGDLPQKKWKNAGRTLKLRALARGRLHPPLA
ncbi:MAG: hypothetical protein IPK82_03670 [Polyangiaceae bacterium]|nr:hypothetical protein [Polyangiaceae bacterium]